MSTDAEAPEYVIASTPRSGSSLLGALLTQSGLLGHPEEYLNQSVHVPQLARKFGLVGAGGQLDLEAYVDVLRTKTATPNGAFGLKTHNSHIEPLKALPAIQRLLARSRFIWITREDIVARAVSFYIAGVTKQWSSLDTARAAVPPFDAKAIGTLLAEIQRQNAGWERFFAINDVPMTAVTYEALQADPAEVNARLSAFLEIDLPPFVPLEEAGIERQSTKLNADYIQRFRDIHAIAEQFRQAA